uniref:NB-ARC domains-containing protein n=1 Tax=Tanacetum cinerariifolium TaxID=118510 RepID=A0A6L2MDT1_TANCI|nr:NB-ARC domains-containing protein [Tanacetum cinerariifolium]
MAELILSALLPIIFEKLTSVAKEVTDEAVKDWLNGLQHLAYDIDDILDGFATDAAMHHEFTNESEGITSRVRKLIPTCCTNFSLSTRMDGKLYSITTRLQELIDKKNDLGLIVKDGGPKSKNRNYQTSLVDVPSIVGREGDKKELLQKLLYDEPCSQNFSIVPIVGMGGIGKTTLARLLYDDQQVKDRFELKAWVCVSDDFDSFNISQVIFQSIAPFFEAAHGSKIIITTRKTELLRKLGHKCPYNLQKLSHNDAVSLFARHAGINDFESYPTLRLHGEGIVKKCDGLPLALKALGSLLRTKTDEEDWKQLLDNEIWMLKDGGGIISTLRLRTVFEKDDLILLWMAEGFLHNSATKKSMERLGEEYFQELLSRLDVDVEKNVRKEAFKKYRHMSFACEEFITYNKFKAFERANSLRTFIAMPNVVGNSWQIFNLSSKILVNTLPQLPLLRVLSLSRLDIDEVPECVGNMKHLWYLNLSGTRITHLPEIVCNLYNLQTLIVSGCNSLTTLPNNFLKLKNLQHFDIRDTLLWNMMPLGISEMKTLQILSNKIVVENNDFFISGLKNLKNLQRNISIHGLDKVQSARDIWEVNLSQKRASELHVEWSNDFNDARNETLDNEVMNALKPHSDDLKDLLIESYGGKVFPNWIGDPSFLLLTCVEIRGCRKCTFLPPLGQLPSLKKLDIQDMSGWEVWSTNSGGVDAVFPRLQKLAIAYCPNLVELSFAALPSMRDLYLNDCGDGVLTSLIHVASAVTKLSIWSISGLSDEVWRSVMDYLGEVEEKGTSSSLSQLMDVNNYRKRSLGIGGLKTPISKWGPQNFPPSLVDLWLLGGSAEEDDMTSVSQLSHMLPSSLTKLGLWGFEKLKSV